MNLISSFVDSVEPYDLAHSPGFQPFNFFALVPKLIFGTGGKRRDVQAEVLTRAMRLCGTEPEDVQRNLDYCEEGAMAGPNQSKGGKHWTPKTRCKI